MANVLLINACVRENSRTLELARHVLSQWQTEVEEVKLYDCPPAPLDRKGMQMRDGAVLAKDFSHPMFTLARQFAAAETVIIAAPYWDLMFPAVLKTYFENITVNGLTFAYSENGIPYGMCKVKKLIYVTTSGGPIFCNFGYDYVAALAKNFYGIKDVSFVSAQGLDIKGADAKAILEQAKDAYTMKIEDISK
jgi:FMN-dependent NADH-azoreductase